MVGEQDASLTGRAARVLEDGLDRFRAAVREKAAVVVVRHTRDQCFREQARKRRALHLHQIRKRQLHRVAQCLLDPGMATPEREDAEPGEEVEVAAAVAIEQVGPLGPDVVGVEADRAQYAWHLRVHVALVQRERFLVACCEQRFDVEGRSGGGRGAHRSWGLSCASCVSSRSTTGPRPSWPARRIRSTRASFTKPLSTNHRAARNNARRAGMLV